MTKIKNRTVTTNLVKTSEVLNTRIIAEIVANKITELRRREGLNFSDFAILYRMNAQSMNLETMFAKGGIPYRMLGSLRFYDRKEVKDIILSKYALYFVKINIMHYELCIQHYFNLSSQRLDK